MNKRQILITILTASMIALIVMATEKANFKGQWVMDKAKSEGLPPDMEQRMKVEQDGDKIEIETDVFQGDNINTVHDRYIVDGKEGEVTAVNNAGEQTQAKRIAVWNKEGDGFEVRDVAKFEKETFSTVRKWKLSADGKSLVIELQRTGPQGSSSSKRTFNKK